MILYDLNDDGTWEYHSQLYGTGDNSNFGYSLALDSDSDSYYIVIGSPAAFHSKDFDGKSSAAGQVHLFEVPQGSTSWLTKSSFSGNAGGDGYGWSVARHSSSMLIGAPFETSGTGAAWLMDPNNLPLPTAAIGFSIYLSVYAQLNSWYCNWCVNGSGYAWHSISCYLLQNERY